jgi:transcriptional regulator with XRE-family HTH domain
MHFEVRYDAPMVELGLTTDRLAAMLRELRAARGWSLDEASERLGVGRRSLVALERGGGNPSLSTLLRLAEGYGVGFAELLGDVRKRSLTARPEADAPTLWSTNQGSRARLLIASDELELWSWELSPGDVRDSEPHRPGTTEIVQVQRGRLVVDVSPDREELGAGRVALFAGDRPHRFENLGRSVAVFTLIVHEPVR